MSEENSNENIADENNQQEEEKEHNENEKNENNENGDEKNKQENQEKQEELVKEEVKQNGIVNQEKEKGDQKENEVVENQKNPKILDTNLSDKNLNNEVKNNEPQQMKDENNNVNENNDNQMLNKIMEINKKNNILTNNSPTNNEDILLVNQKSEKQLNEKINFFQNINDLHADDISFSKQGIFTQSLRNSKKNLNKDPIFNQEKILPIGLKKNTLQLLNEINSDMDNLTNDLNPIFASYQIPTIKQNPVSDLYRSNYDFNDYNIYDNQDREMINLIKKANQSQYFSQNKYNNSFQYNNSSYNNDNDNYGNYNNNYNNSINLYDNGYNNNEYNYNDLCNEDYGLKTSLRGYKYLDMDLNTLQYKKANYDKGEIYRNIEKNVDQRHKKMVFGNKSYYNNRYKPLIYSQNRSKYIENSCMNDNLRQPQSFIKMNCGYINNGDFYSSYNNKRRNNLIFSSDKIPYKNRRYENINQRYDNLMRKNNKYY